MKRGLAWIAVLMICGLAVIVARNLLVRPRSVPPSLALSAEPSELLEPAKPGTTERPSRTNEFAPLRPRTNAAPLQTAQSAAQTNRVARVPRSADPAPASSAEQPEISTRVETPALSPRTLEGGSVNPVTEAPEREIIGIGAVLAMDNGALRVRGTLPNSPAALANLDGCVIEAIDGIKVSELSLRECTERIRGLEGTPLKLDVLLPHDERQTLQLVRNKVQLAPPSDPNER